MERSKVAAKADFCRGVPFSSSNAPEVTFQEVWDRALRESRATWTNDWQTCLRPDRLSVQSSRWRMQARFSGVIGPTSQNQTSEYKHTTSTQTELAENPTSSQVQWLRSELEI